MQVFRPSDSVDAVEDESVVIQPIAVDIDDEEDEYEGVEPSVVALNAIERREFEELMAVENSPAGMLNSLVMLGQRLMRRFVAERFESTDKELVEFAAISRTIKMRHLPYLSQFEAGQYRDVVAAVGTNVLLSLFEQRCEVLYSRLAAGETAGISDKDLVACNDLLHEIGGHYLGSFDPSQCFRFNTAMGRFVMAVQGPTKVPGVAIRFEDEDDDELDVLSL